MGLRLDYLLRELYISFRRNFTLFTGTLLTVLISLSMLGGGLLIREAVQHATARWQDGVEFIIFMNPDSAQPQQDAIRSSLDDSPEVDKYTFFDKNDAYAEFQDLFRDSPQLVESVNADVLPTSFRVVPVNPDAEIVEALSDQFRAKPGVRAVVSGTDTIRDFQEFTNRISNGFVWISAFLLAAALLLVFNTIRTAIFARRREIEVMRLVGASNWYIRLPFMIEGVLQGILGGALSMGVLWFINRFFLSNIGGDGNEGLALLTGFEVGQGTVFVIGLSMVALGGAIGAVASGVAISRHLDV